MILPVVFPCPVPSLWFRIVWKGLMELNPPGVLFPTHYAMVLVLLFTSATYVPRVMRMERA
jgi:hypothetical protein